MRALLRYILVVAILIAALVWLAEHPGQVVLEWLGWRAETNLAVLIAAALAVAALVVLVTWLFRLATRGPRRWTRARIDKTRRQQLRAFASGMIAASAGDAPEARRHARILGSFREDRALALLLAAQVAQAENDSALARQTFEEMVDRPETELLGLRGLTSLEMRAGDDEAALAHAEAALRLKPALPWALAAVLEIQARRGHWAAVRAHADTAARARALPPSELAGLRLASALGLAETAEAENRPERALEEADRALEAAPDSTEALAAKARALIALGRASKAAQLIEKAWPDAASPALAALYTSALSDLDPLSRVKRFEKLVARAPHDPESRLALGQAAREARLWGEAKRHFEDAARDPRTERRALLALAELAEADGNDRASAATYRLRAAEAPPEPPRPSTSLALSPQPR